MTCPYSRRRQWGIRLGTFSVFAWHLSQGAFATIAVIIAAQQPGSAVVAEVSVAMSAAWLLLGYPIGWCVDRFGLLAALRTTSVARLVLLALIAPLLTGSRFTPILLVCTTLLLAASHIAYETAVEVSVPLLIGTAGLSRGYGVLAVAEISSYQLLGPLVAAFLGDGSGLAAPAMLFAFTLFATICMELSIHLFRAAPNDTRSPEMGGGIVTPSVESTAPRGRRRPVLRLLLSVGGISSLVNGAALTVLPLLLIGAGGGGWTSREYALLLAVGGAGGVIGSLAVGPLIARFGHDIVLRTSRALIAAAYAAPFLGPKVFTFIAFLGGNIFVYIWTVQSVVLRQQVLTVDELGRVSGVFRTTTLGSAAVGAALVGFVSGQPALTTLLIASAVMSTMLLVPVAVLGRHASAAPR